MRSSPRWWWIGALSILLALLAPAGAGCAREEEAPSEQEPPGVVVERGSARPRAPARRAPPGATPSPALDGLAGEIRVLRERVEAHERTLTALLEAPSEQEPGVVVEMGPAEPRAPARPAPPGAAPFPALDSLAGEIRALRERMEVLERKLTGLQEALPMVASGVAEVPPSARQLADPIAEPLGFARLQPGQTTVRHGLGPVEVTIQLAVLSAEGRVSYQVPAEGLFASAPTPPDGTFTIFNATESPLWVRWWAMLQLAPGRTGRAPE